MFRRIKKEFEAESKELSVYLDLIQDPATKYATYMKTYIFSDIQFKKYENQFLDILKQIQEGKYSNDDLRPIYHMILNMQHHNPK